MNAMMIDRRRPALRRPARVLPPIRITSLWPANLDLTEEDIDAILRNQSLMPIMLMEGNPEPTLIIGKQFLFAINGKITGPPPRWVESDGDEFGVIALDMDWEETQFYHALKEGTAMKPTNGRIVYYYPAKNEKGGDHDNQPHPAMVCYVHDDGKINLSITNPSGMQYQRSRIQLVQEGEEAPAGGGYAAWMPYQTAAAKQYPVEVPKAAPAVADATESVAVADSADNTGGVDSAAPIFYNDSDFTLRGYRKFGIGRDPGALVAALDDQTQKAAE